MKRFSLALQIWLAALFVCAAATSLSFAYADVPIARLWFRSGGAIGMLGEGLGSAVILSGEAVTVAAIALVRVIRGRVPVLAEIVAIACVASMCAYAVDVNVLKLLFGVPNPHDVMEGAAHALNPGAGSARSSFPSGHMALAGSFAGVIMPSYRMSVWPLAGLILLAGILLVVGDWHFLSDVIAGAFLGVSAGLLAGQLWKVHAGVRAS